MFVHIIPITYVRRRDVKSYFLYVSFMYIYHKLKCTKLKYQFLRIDTNRVQRIFVTLNYFRQQKYHYESIAFRRILNTKYFITFWRNLSSVPTYLLPFSLYYHIVAFSILQIAVARVLLFIPVHWIRSPLFTFHGVTWHAILDRYATRRHRC